MTVAPEKLTRALRGAFISDTPRARGLSSGSGSSSEKLLFETAWARDKRGRRGVTSYRNYVILRGALDFPARASGVQMVSGYVYMMRASDSFGRRLLSRGQCAGEVGIGFP